MCQKTQFKYCPSQIDKCMKPLIKYLNSINVITCACCCGHGKYPMTIVVRPRVCYPFSFGKRKVDKDCGFEILSKTFIPRKRKFYKTDEEGYYHIPEVTAKS